MQVLLEPTETGVRVSSGAPLGITIEATDEQEAMALLHEAVAERLRSGARLVEVTIAPSLSGTENPWQQIAGIFREDASFEEWQAAIQSHRDAENAEEGPW